MLNLKQLRLERQLTQAGLAQALDVAQTTVSSWERGEKSPDPDTLIRLANFYNVSVDYLLGRENEKEPAAIFEDERQAELNAIFERMPDEASKDKMIQLVRSFEITNKYEIGHQHIVGIAAKGGNKPIVHRIPPKKK